MAMPAALLTLGVPEETPVALLLTPAETLAGVLEVNLVEPAAAVVEHAACEYPPPDASDCTKCVYSCNEEGHFARECPQKPEGGGGLTGECYNCGEVG